MDGFLDILKNETGYKVPKKIDALTLKKRDVPFNAKTPHRDKQRGGKWKKLYTHLLNECTGWVKGQGMLTYARLKEYVDVLVKKTTAIVVNFGCCNGWINGFCTRNDLKTRRRCGELVTHKFP